METVRFPEEARALLAVAPTEFIAERERLVKQLRGEGRRQEATALSKFPKPSPPVLAVNRAARERPKAAQSAFDAAARLAKAQLASDPKAFARASEDLQGALDVLSEIAVTHVSAGKASEQMQRRVRDLLRSAAASSEARQALRDGTLTAELEPTGFDAFAGMTVAPSRRGRSAEQKSSSLARRRKRERELRDRLSAAIERMEAAEESVGRAEVVHSEATKEVEAIRSSLERLLSDVSS